MQIARSAAGVDEEGGAGSKAPATAPARRWRQIHHGHEEARDRFVVGRANRDGFLPRAARLPVPVPSLEKWWLVLVPSSLLLRW